MQLYRGLLGREPEAPDTLPSFKNYYPTIERGRRAIFNSDEFERYFARVTGRILRAREAVAPGLALALLTRAAGAFGAVAPAVPPANPAIRAGMRMLLSAYDHHPPARLVVTVGRPNHFALDDLVPLRDPNAAVLHIDAGYPPVVPLVDRLPGGTVLFRLSADAEAVAALLRQFGHGMDALLLLGRPADIGWVNVLHGHFAPRVLLAIGPGSDGFDAAALSAAVDRSHQNDRAATWHGLHLHRFGPWGLPVTYRPPASSPDAPILDDYPKLAIAAIVRDEAACIENMLRSARPVASFFAVLDTGSTDGTPALAQAFLAASGVPHVVAERDAAAFDDDFSAMRNAALALIPDWVEWVLMLDADEALAPEDYSPLLALIGSATHDVFALPRYNFPKSDLSGAMIEYPDRQVRLLRHQPNDPIAFSGAVHETVRGRSTGSPPLDATAIGGSRGGPHIHHLVRRFRTPEQEALKQERYREIARRHKLLPQDT